MTTKILHTSYESGKKTIARNTDDAMNISIALWDLRLVFEKCGNKHPKLYGIEVMCTEKKCWNLEY